MILETVNMEDSSHFSENESEEKHLIHDVLIKEEIEIKPEMGLNLQEYENLTVNSEIPDNYESVSSSGIPWIKQEIEDGHSFHWNHGIDESLGLVQPPPFYSRYLPPSRTLSAYPPRLQPSSAPIIMATNGSSPLLPLSYSHCTTSSPHPVLLPPLSHTTSFIHPEQYVKGGRIEGRGGWRTLQTRGEVKFEAHIEARSSFAKLREGGSGTLLSIFFAGRTRGRASLRPGVDTPSVSLLYLARAEVAGQASAAC
uniref:Uncharacterized protein n=1 Tax=Timema shepardi TaxID=629360 RepID=A0A7R9B398_TIMSH|nr:unnamed protein product [Timema shepardi]